MLLIAIMIMMVILPLKLSFFKIFDDRARDHERETWYAAVIILDIIFLADVVLSFFTGTIEHKQNPPMVGMVYISPATGPASLYFRSNGLQCECLLLVTG